jgi:serine phosphatase RsbU (regulator of sigma subunit)
VTALETGADERATATSPPSDTTKSDDVPRRAHRSRRHAVPILAVVAGAIVFGTLAIVCRVVSNQNEQRLLQEQTNQAAALLSVSVGQTQAPLIGAAGTAAATDGNRVVFDRITAPLLSGATPYSTILLIDAQSGQVVDQQGVPPQLLAAGPAALPPVLDRAHQNAFVVVDLLDRNRTLGYAAPDDPQAPRYVVYAERTLNPNPSGRRRTDQPFSQFDYALYLGGQENPQHLLSATRADLPISGRRATSVITFGDRNILLVATPLARLGGSLITNLWWIVLLAGALVTIGTAVLLWRLQRTRERALLLAQENARKHREQRDIAEVLQRGLLPERLDAPAGSALAARYWPADDASLIGGDFYDAFRIDDRRWGLVIGDVCGSGIQAAALIGLARHTIRTASRAEESPAEVLLAVHRAMKDHQPATFCTVCFAIYESSRGSGGSGVLTVALGGHPQPLLLRAGRVTPIGQSGTVLGMIEPVIAEQRVEVSHGDLFLLFTDGLTDAPADQVVTIDELVGLVAANNTDVDALSDLIGDRIRTRRQAGSNDDTALLIIRFDTISEAETGGATPAEAPPEAATAPVD